MKFFQLLFLLFLFSCQENSKQETNKTQKIELEVSITESTSPIRSSIRGISCVDSNTIWLSGAKGSILRSLDKGNNWEQLSAPDNDSLDFRDVEAFSANEAVIVSAGFPSRIYRTKNGGKSWALVHENTDSTAFMNSVAFKNNEEGIILGDQLNGRHLILKSNDGGQSWNRIDSTFIPKPLAIENGFAASGSCIAINKEGSFFIGLGGEQTRVFSSTEGLYWNATTTPMAHGIDGASGIYSIAYGNNNLIAVGGSYLQADSSHYPILSHDNGESWEKTKGMVSGYRSVIDYCPEQGLWVCGGTNGIDFSQDNGVKWEKASSDNINTLQFLPNTSRAIAANSKGNIFILDFHLTN